VNDSSPAWSEANSRTFIDIADVAVPDREEQLEVLLSLVPAASDEAFGAADVCCGEGRLAEVLLQRFPRCTVEALDGSDTMLAAARRRLAPFGTRASVRRFDLDSPGWTEGLPSPLRCIISSLGLHHLDDEQKRVLFRRLRDRLEDGGVLLIADIVAPASDLIRGAHTQAWHRAARRQSEELSGSTAIYDRAVSEHWAYYDVEENDDIDKPSPLFDQLKWLEEAGFSAVDCFWMRAGFAVYGGYR
jgi:trans-aconitate methyltransferase